MVGLGLPTQRHLKMTLEQSSLCLMLGRSVKVGRTPSAGGNGASSPVSIIKEPDHTRGGGNSIRRTTGGRSATRDDNDENVNAEREEEEEEEAEEEEGKEERKKKNNVSSNL